MKTLVQKLFLASVMCSLPIFLQAQTISTTASTLTSCPGEIHVAVTVTNCNGVGAISQVLAYNNAVLSYLGYMNLHSALASGMLIVNSTGSKVILSWASTTAANIGNDTLIEFRFSALPGSSNLTWDTQTPGNCEYTNLSGQVIPSTWINGSASIHQPPAVTVQPVDRIIAEGTGTSFSLTATGSGLNYLWKESTDNGNTWNILANTGIYSGVYTPILSISEVTLGMNGYRYKCTVTGSCPPEVNSNSGLLTTTPNIITTCHPVTACPGEIVILVTVSDFINVGAFSLKLNTTSTVLTYNGYEDLNAELTSGTFTDNESGGSIFLSWSGVEPATIGSGDTLLKLIFNGMTGSAPMTWDTITPGACEYSDSTGLVIFSDWINGLATVQQQPTVTVNPPNRVIPAGSATTFPVSATGAGLNYQWQLSTDNGDTWNDLSNGGNYINVTTATLSLSTTDLSMDSNLYRCRVSGTCPPEVFSWPAMLTVTPYILTTCQTVTACPGPIAVPVKVSNFIGVAAFSMELGINPAVLTYSGYQNLNSSLEDATFVLNSTGDGISLSWFSTTPLTLGNSSTLIELLFNGIPGTSPMAWDTVTPGACEYSDLVGKVIYSTWVNGLTTVLPPPSISLQPPDRTIPAGSNTSFPVSASGAGLAYLWQVSTDGGYTWNDLANGSVYNNVTTPTLSLTGVTLSMDGYNYRCRISGTCEPQVFSDPALLIVTPLIYTSLQNIAACPGAISVQINVTNFIGVAAFTMKLGVNPSVLSYTGTQNLNAGLNSGTFSANSSGNDIYLSWYSTTAATLGNGATLIELLFTASPGTSAMAWDTVPEGSCEYSDLVGQIIFSNWISGNANIHQPPQITVHPLNRTIFAGGNTSFSSVASGAGLNYQWQESPDGGNTWADLSNGGIYSNVTTTTLGLTSVPYSMNGNMYRCKAAGTCSPQAFSNPAMLAVTPVPITTRAVSFTNSCTRNIKLPVMVNQCNNAGSISLALVYDTNKYVFDGLHKAHEELLSGFLSVNRSGNKVLLSWASTDPADIGEDTLVIYRFISTDNANSAMNWDTLTPGACEYSDINGVVITSHYINSNVSVAGNALLAVAGPDTIMMPGDTATLAGSASGGAPPYIFTWSPESGLSDPNISDPEASPALSTSYTLIVTDQNGCIASDVMNLNVAYVIPELSTSDITDIGITTATGGGNISFDGGVPVTQRGICWSTGVTPLITDSHTLDGTGSGIFTSALTGLAPYTTYHARAYAINSVGIAYGNEVMFTTLPNPVNIAPLIDSIPDPEPIAEDSGQQTVQLTGISDGNEGLEQNISITASSSDASIIPDPIVNYIPNATTGSLNYTPLPNANGTVTIIVTVMDDGGTANGGINTTQISFQVAVLAVNDQPVAMAGNDTTTAGGLTVTLNGSGSYDPDGDSLYFSWIAPAGIVLDDSTAILPSFTAPDTCGAISYMFRLLVNDGTLNSPPDTVIINSLPASTDIYSAGDPVVCPGIPLQLIAPSGNGRTFRWLKDQSAMPGETGEQLTVTEAASYSVEINHAGLCVDTSNTIIVSLNPDIPEPAISGPVVACQGSTLNTYTTEAGMSAYTWSVSEGGTITDGSGTHSVVVLWSNTGGQWISVSYTGETGCRAVDPTVKDVTVNPVLPVSVTIEASRNPICQGGEVTFTASPVNGGDEPLYEWFVNDSLVTASGSNSNGLVAYYPFNGNASDMSGSGHHGTVLNAVPTTDRFGNSNSAYSFNGTADCYINTGVWNIPDAFTISAFVYPYTLQPNSGGIVTKYNDYLTEQRSVLTGIYNGTADFRIWQNGVEPSFYLDIDSILNIDNWYHLVWTYNGTNRMKMYLNGELLSEKNDITTTGIFDSNIPVHIGRITDCWWPHKGGFNGKIDEVRIYDRALSDIEVMGLFNENSPELTYSPSDGDVIYCVMTSSESCTSGNPDTSNMIIMNVSTSPAVEVNIEASETDICERDTVCFTATVINGGTNPTYEWLVNGSLNEGLVAYYPFNGNADDESGYGNNGTNHGATLSNDRFGNANSAYSFDGVNDYISTPNSNSLSIIGDITMNSWVYDNGDNSTNTYHTILNKRISNLWSYNLSISLISGGSGQEYKKVISGRSSPGPIGGFKFSSEQVNFNEWYNVTVVIHNDTITFYKNGSNIGFLPAFGNYFTMPMVNQLVGLTIGWNNDVANPHEYMWGKLDDIRIYNRALSESEIRQLYFINNENFCYTPANGDTVTCIVTSSEVCITNNPDTSNLVIMSVIPVSPVSLSIQATDTLVCQGTEVTFTATATNEGSSPVYQWMVNGVNEGTNNPDFTYTPQDGDQICCRLTSDAECATGNPATSDTIVMQVDPVLEVNMEIFASVNPVCEGGQVTYTVTPTNEGKNPVFQWFVNDSLVQSGAPVEGLIAYYPFNGNANDQSGNDFHGIPNGVTFVPDRFNNISNACFFNGSSFINVNNVTKIPLGNEARSISAWIKTSSSNYNQVIVDWGTLLLSQRSSAMIWNINGCSYFSGYANDIPGNNYVSDNQWHHLVFTFNGSSLKIFVDNTLDTSTTMTLNTSGNDLCIGKGIPGNSGIENFNGVIDDLRIYDRALTDQEIQQLYFSFNFSYYTYSPSDGDSVYCVLTASEDCFTNNPDTSNIMIMSVDPSPEAGVSIQASANPVCNGSPVTFTATPVNGGSTPVFQWKVNGLNAGTNSPSFSYQPAAGDRVSCSMTSSQVCVTNNPAISDTITLLVIHPEISVLPSSLEEFLTAGSSSDQVIRIKNEGDCDLAVTLSDQAGWLNQIPGSGNVSPGDSLQVNIGYSATGLTHGNYNTMLTISSNDPDEPSVQIPVSLTVYMALSVNAEAAPPIVCSGDTVYLKANAAGGSGTLHYSWTSIPEGFVSSLASPKAIPASNTTYYLMVRDDMDTLYDQVYVNVVSQPLFAELSVNSLVFDTLLLGNTQGKYFEIFNSGCDTLEFTLAVSTPFSLNPEQFSIDPEQSKLVNVYFNPTTTGDFSDQVLFTTNAANVDDLEVSLSGHCRIPRVDILFQDSVTVVPSVPDASDQVSLRFGIKLTGEKGFEGIRYIVKDSISGQSEIFTIGSMITPGSTWPVEYPIPRLLPPGPQRWIVSLDPANLIQETNEANNRREKVFQVLTLPELSCEEIILSDTQAMIGTPVQISTRFRNQGQSAAGQAVYKLIASGSFGFSEVIDSGQVDIPGNDDLTIQAVYTPMAYPGTIAVSSFIDADNDFAETDETDNARSASFIAILPSPILTAGGASILDAGIPSTYTITFFNNGLVTLEDLNIDVNLPALLQVLNANPLPEDPQELIWQFPSLAAGQSEVITIQILYPGGSSGGGSIINLDVESSYTFSGNNYELATSRSIQLGLDTRPPQILVSLSSDYLATGPAVIILAADESLGNPPSFFITGPGMDTVISGTYTGSGNAWNASFNALPGWPEGNYSIHTLAADSSGNVSNTIKNFIFDKTAPELIITAPPAAGHQAFSFTLVTDDELSVTPSVSITANTSESITPVLVSQAGLRFNYMAAIPSGIICDSILITIEVINRAGTSSTASKSIMTDFMPPVISHNLPSVLTPGYIFATLNSDEPLTGIPQVWITDISGISVPFEGPFDMGSYEYSIIISAPVNSYTGAVTFLCSSTDMAGNNSLLTWEMSYDNKGPDITIVTDPEIPAGNFAVKIFTSETVQYPFDITFYGNEPGQVLSIPAVIIHDDYYEFNFQDANISKIEVSAQDISGNSGAAEKSYCDLSMPAFPYQFSAPANGLSDCEINIPVANSSGIAVKNVPVVLLNYGSSPVQRIGDTVFTDLSAYETRWIGFTWPAAEQQSHFDLVAKINPVFSLPETSYLNNISQYRRFNFIASLDKNAYSIDSDTVVHGEIFVISSVSGDTLAPPGILSYLKVYDPEFENLVIDSLPGTFHNYKFDYDILTSSLSDTGYYKAVFFINDTSGLAPATDTLDFYLSAPLTVTVQANDSLYNRNVAVEISGVVTLGQSEPVISQKVNLIITGKIGRRVYSVETDSSGSYSFIFQPFPNEAGVYRVHVLVDRAGINRIDSCRFEILGLYASPSIYEVKLSRNSSVDGSITLKNIGDVDLGSLMATINPPDSEGVSLILQNVPSIVQAGSTVTIPFQVVAGPGNPANVSLEVTFSAESGEQETVVFNIETAQAVPHVYALTGNTEVILLPGESRIVSIDFKNSGFAPALHPQFTLPGISFVQLFNSPAAGEIGVDEIYTCNLLIAPGTEVPIGLYTGYLTLSCDNCAPAQTGVSIYVTLNSVGNLQLTVNNTLDLPVTGASVILYSQTYNPYTHSYPAYSATTNGQGDAFFYEIPTGNYHYQVSAENNTSATGSFYLHPMVSNPPNGDPYQHILVTLNFNPYTVEWNVSDTVIEDTYEVHLVTTISPVEDSTGQVYLPPSLVPVPKILSHTFGFSPIQSSSFSIYNFGDIPAYDIKPMHTDIIAKNSVNGPELYRIMIIYSEPMLTTGLEKGQSGKVNYLIYKLVPDNNTNPVRTWLKDNEGRVWFTAKYMFNGEEQTTQFFVDLDLKTEINCLEVVPGALARVVVNNVTIGQTESVYLTNPNSQGTTTFNGGLGTFFFSVDEKDLILSAITLLAPGASMAVILAKIAQGLRQVETYVDLADKVINKNFDVVISNTSIPPNMTKEMDVVWSPQSLSSSIIGVDFGLLYYVYSCQNDGNLRAWAMPMFQTRILTFNQEKIIIGEPYPPEYIPDISRDTVGPNPPVEEPEAILDTIPPQNGDTTSFKLPDKIIMGIDQKLTMERQAFNVRFNLVNNTDYPVKNFSINVITKGEYGNIISEDETSAACPFYFRLFNPTGITGIKGTGVIAPHQTGRIHWLAIPRVGSGGEAGKTYQLQGNFSFTIAGKNLDDVTTNAAVKVLPLPVLDIAYSLPENFFKDSSFFMTVSIENNGFGSANNVKLTSGQPKLECYNEANDPVSCSNVNVEILGGFLANEYQNQSMTMNFGNISPWTAKVGYWEFLANFSGIISGFDATFEHADYLGGMSTSLVNSVNTYVLLQMIKPEKHSREISSLCFAAIDSTFDHLPDYIQDAGSGIKQSAQILTGINTHPATFDEPYLNITLNNSAGWGYFNAPQPFIGSKIIESVSSSTGYNLSSTQYWTENNRIYIIDDMVANASYVITFRDPPRADLALFEELLCIDRGVHVVNYPVEFSMDVYNGGDQQSQAAILDLYRVIGSDSLVQLDGYPFGMIEKGHTVRIDGLIPEGEIMTGWNHFRLILDPDSLFPDNNRMNNTLDFNVLGNTQSDSIVFSDRSTDRIRIDWSDGDCPGRLVFMKEDTLDIAAPVKNTTYMANSVFGAGSQIGTSGWFCVFNGTSHENGILVTGLSPGTKYRVMSCEYKGNPGNEQYDVSVAPGNPANGKTCPVISPVITGPVNACLRTGYELEYNYSTEAGMNDYIWFISPGGSIISGAASNTVTVSWDTPGQQYVGVIYSSTEGCSSISGTQYIVLVDSLTIPGTVTGGSYISLGSLTDTLVLTGYRGSVLVWQRLFVSEGDTYTDIPDTEGLEKYIAMPAMPGTWQYRAVVRNDSCFAEYSEPAIVMVTQGGLPRSWTGAIDEKWHVAGNWNPVGVPGPDDDVLIRQNVPHMPEVKVAGLSCRKVVLEPGANLLILNGVTLHITGTATK